MIKFFRQGILGISLFIVSIAFAVELPDIGDPSQEVISPAQEVELGRSIFQQIRAQGLIIGDPLLQEYIRSIGQRITTYIGQDTGAFTFFIVDEASINAFAAPGGFIGVHTGLILATRSESELAGVLAHETAHVTQRHIARRIADASRMRIPMAAAVLAAVLAASASSSGQVGGAAATGLMAANAQREINFTRRNEIEADRVAADLMARSRFDPNGLPDFFERLAQQSRLYGAGAPEFLRTHPVETQRISETRGRISEKSGIKPTPDTDEYFLAHARIQAFGARDPNEARKLFEANIRRGEHPRLDSQRYGLALSLMRLGDMDGAAERARELLRSRPESLVFLILAAEIEFASGRTDAAKTLYERAERLFPTDYSLAMTYGEMLINSGDSRRAMALLRPHLKQDIARPEPHALYARAARANGQIAESHAAMSEFYYLWGNLPLSIQQAEVAMNSLDITPYLHSRLQARVLRLRQELKDSEE